MFINMFIIRNNSETYPKLNIFKLNKKVEICFICQKSLIPTFITTFFTTQRTFLNLTTQHTQILKFVFYSNPHSYSFKDFLYTKKTISDLDRENSTKTRLTKTQHKLLALNKYQ